MNHIIKFKHSLKKIIKRLSITTVLISVAIIVLIVAVVRPMVTTATAVRVTFIGCTAVADKGLQIKINRTFTFKVTTETDDTFLMEDFGIKQPIQAGKSRMFSVKPKESKWYGFKLAKCQNAGGALIAFKSANKLPSMGNMRYSNHEHDSPKKSDNSSDDHNQGDHGY